MLIRKYLTPNWPSIYNLRIERKLLNKRFDVVKHGKGAYSSFKEKLNYLININSEKYSTFEKLQIKLTADGTNVGRNLKLLNIAFVILNEAQTAKSAKGHYLIGVYELEKENHENLKLSGCFEKINIEIDATDKVKIKDKEIEVEYFVANDWKKTANMLDLPGPTSNNPCFLCTCHKNEFWDTTKTWSGTIHNVGAYIIEMHLIGWIKSEYI